MVDKLYIMLPEFRTVFNWNKLENDILKVEGFKKWGRDKVKMTLEMIQNGNIVFEDNSPEEAIYDYYAENRNKYLEPRKVKYNISKEPKDNSREARNNMMIDLMYGILTNKDISPQFLRPGGFEKQSAAAKVCQILENLHPKEIASRLIDLGYKVNNLSDVYSILQNIDNDTLKKVLGNTLTSLNPLSPVTQITFHQQNMTGGKMIGIYANHNANHAIMQFTDLAVSSKHTFTFNSKDLTSLHSIETEDGRLVSEGTSNYLAASVDNVKDSTLQATNQNEFTADASAFLARLGYTNLEIGILMNQPIIKEMTSYYFKERKKGKSQNAAISDILEKTKKTLGITMDVSYNTYADSKFDLNGMMQSISYNSFADKDITSDEGRKFYAHQLRVGYLFQRITEGSNSLAKVVAATRADTGNGAAGPTIADTISKELKVIDLLNDIQNNKLALTGARVIDAIYTKGITIDNLREMLYNSKLPYIQAFSTLGIFATDEFLSPYFPHYNSSFIRVIQHLSDISKNNRLNVKTINSIYNDLFAYILSRTEFFGSDNTTTSTSKRENFIKNFPAKFKEIVSNNPDIAELDFIKRLRFKTGNNKVSVATITFSNAGKLTSDLKENFMNDWESLLYMNNPEANKLALDLFRYGFYRSGFAFSPEGFNHLAPIAVREAVPEYIDTLRSLINNNDDYTLFIDQYILNHLDNRLLVPKVDTEIQLFDTIGKPFDNITIYEDSIVKNKTKIDGVYMYDLYEYISIDRGSNTYYYRAVDTTSEGNITGEYIRILPLGIKNQFLEYEYGKSNVSSVFDENNISPEEDIINHKDNNTLQDSTAKSNIEDAYKEVYKEDIEKKNPKDTSDITPNEGYIDANNQKTCR